MTLPKAELHLHLEGSVRPGLARALAGRHGVALADVLTSDDTYLWQDFTGFITTYDRISDAVLTPEDYFAITRDYYVRAAAEGLIYGETFVSPAHAARKGIGYETLIEAIDAGMAAAEAETGVVARIIISCVRHMGPEHAVQVARLVARHPHHRVTGFGMGGDERMHAPADFAPAFAIAGEAGLGLTAHAGELAGPESIRAALRDLGVTRLGHGVRVGEDAALLAEVKARGIGLELCPSSNVALGLFADIAAHPVGAYTGAGLLTTLSTDDPPYFNASIGGEYDQVAAAHGFGRDAMLGFTRRALAAAFVDEDTRAALLAKVV